MNNIIILLSLINCASALSEDQNAKRLLLTDPDVVLNRLRILEEKVALMGAPTNTGSTFVRWGRKQCPDNRTELVYSGYAGGGMYSERGSAAEYVCLTPDPKFDKTSGFDYGRIYGAEFETNFWAPDSTDEDVPCALCRSSYATTIMIPGTNTCPMEWFRQYHGYLASGYYDHPAASSYVCVDIKPEYLHSGANNKDGKLFHDVLAKCGSLPCPPYINDHPLTCVVCSK